MLQNQQCYKTSENKGFLKSLIIAKSNTPFGYFNVKYPVWVFQCQIPRLGISMLNTPFGYFNVKYLFRYFKVKYPVWVFLTMLNSPSGISKSTTLSGIQSRIPGSGTVKVDATRVKIGHRIIFGVFFFTVLYGFKRNKIKSLCRVLLIFLCFSIQVFHNTSKKAVFFLSHFITITNPYEIVYFKAVSILKNLRTCKRRLEVFFVVFNRLIRTLKFPFLLLKKLVVFVPPSCFCYSPYMG